MKSATLVNTIPVAAVTAGLKAFDGKVTAFVPRYDVASYRITYGTVDGQGRLVTASGLLSLPVKPAGVASPVLSYQHATIYHDAEAPTNSVLPVQPPVLLASQGAIVVASDFVGYGASKGIDHPYLLSAPAAASVIDMLTASTRWRQQNGVADNGQLMLLGYSEGAYVSMAAHRALQAGQTSFKAQLRGSVTGAGPYQVEVTLDTLLNRVRNDNPVLAALFSPGLLRYLGSDVRNELRRQLLKEVVPDDADVSFQATFLDSYMADDNVALDRDSNVHDWKPETPVHLFHGRDDGTVPYASSSATLQTMQSLGATQVSLTDCPAVPSSHLGCVPSYLDFAMNLVRAGVTGL